jgi:branched-chain amino acid aminotransferase
MNGEFVPWEEARVHVSSSCVTLGSRVFEGMRAYWNDSQEQLYIFRSAEHLKRLYQSAKIMRMSPAYSGSQLESAYVELLVKNNYRQDVHFTPAIYFDIGHDFISYKPDEIDTRMSIVAGPRKSQLGSGLGIHVCISSWTRISDRDMPPRVKISANYQNGRLAAVQAAEDGYDDAILLNERGKMAEGPGACVFLVRGGVVITPPITAGILESITRATVIQLLQQELSVPVLEREVDRTELYIADEVFYCGSALEITPILSVDRYSVGEGRIGTLSAQLQQIYGRILRGENPKYADWLLPVYRL